MASNRALLSLSCMLALCLSPALTFSFFAPRAESFSESVRPVFNRRQLPAEPTNVTTISSPNGATIRYKEPGKDGVCETTPGVNSYSGYVDLDNQTHMFFWFFEARKDPGTAPLTLWLNGGPGSDSLIGLFQELGPCNVTEDFKTQLNPYAWNEYSNMLFLSQPIGVGFSYQSEVVGIINQTTLYPQNSSKPDGRYAYVDEFRFDTTELAAKGTWEVLQGFLTNLPQLDPTIKSRTFNLWTESYGGHYGPAFFDYFTNQNALIANGSAQGVQLTMDTLGIGNGIISERIQAPYYPEFAVNNTYGIKSINDTIYNFMKMVYYIPNGCRDNIDYCYSLDRTTLDGYTACAQATAICRGLVEVPYYVYGGRGVYDIRHPYDDPDPPSYFEKFLNMASTQDALGVDLNYTAVSSSLVGGGFSYTGDFVYPDFLEDLSRLLNNSVRVSLYYGDADFICNWFGGEAVSKEVQYLYTKEFNAAGYTPFIVDGVEYGEVRQFGNFSFTRIYEAGHEVPFYQPKASLALFTRTLQNLAIADGSPLTTNYSTNGSAVATHTESYVALPTSAAGTAAGTATTNSAAVSSSASAMW